MPDKYSNFEKLKFIVENLTFEEFEKLGLALDESGILSETYHGIHTELYETLVNILETLIEEEA